jgi:hypothetical protein
MDSGMRFKVAGPDILITRSGQTDKRLIDAIESALGVSARRRRFLIYVVRFEFDFYGEVIPFFIDEDGSAHFETSKNSAYVVERLLEAIRLSPHFLET